MTNKRVKLTQQEKFVVFKNAFDTYSHYINSENFIGAFVIAFSIFEDRLSACFYLDFELKGEKYCGKEKYPSVNTRLKRVRLNLEKTEVNMVKRITKFRNVKIHAAMWNLDEIRLIDCEKVVQAARLMDKISKRYKTKIKQKNKEESK